VGDDEGKSSIKGIILSLKVHLHELSYLWLFHQTCSLPLWRVHGIKRMYLAPRIHGLFITETQFRLSTTFNI
jgi:hypothetical protein